MVSGAVFRQAKPSGDGVIQPGICLRRLKLNGFCGTIGHARIAALAGVIPDRALVREGDVAAGAAARGTACRLHGSL